MHRVRPYRAWWTLALLAISAALIFLAPVAMPEGYSAISHVISESAAQGVQNAWVARFGFLTFGFSVLILSTAGARETSWPLATVWMLRVFAVCMIATAAFSHRPWVEGITYDEMEDLLHSITATGMGFAFSFGVASRLIVRHADAVEVLFDLFALGAAIVIPLLGLQLPEFDGLLQRLLFAIAYLWFAREIAIWMWIPPQFKSG